MVSILKQTIRREEAGIKIRELVKRGYWEGRWLHIPQTDYIELRAWKPESEEQRKRHANKKRK